jgi:hypothetical protein
MNKVKAFRLILLLVCLRIIMHIYIRFFGYHFMVLLIWLIIGGVVLIAIDGIKE